MPKSKSESDCQALKFPGNPWWGPDLGVPCNGKVQEYGLQVPVYMMALCLACIWDCVQKSCLTDNGWLDDEGCISFEFRAFVKFLIDPSSEIPLEFQALAEIVKKANNLQIGKTYQATVDHSIKGCLTEVRVCKLEDEWHLELTIGGSLYSSAEYDFVICSE